MTKWKIKVGISQNSGRKFGTFKVLQHITFEFHNLWFERNEPVWSCLTQIIHIFLPGSDCAICLSPKDPTSSSLIQLGCQHGEFNLHSVTFNQLLIWLRKEVILINLLWLPKSRLQRGQGVMGISSVQPDIWRILLSTHPFRYVNCLWCYKLNLVRLILER